MKSKRQGTYAVPLIPWKDCKDCGAKEAVITHSEDGNLWCSKCGAYTKLPRKSVKDGK